jgi:hypothetical protein
MSRFAAMTLVCTALLISIAETKVRSAEPAVSNRVFRAGAAEVDISPKTLPVIVSGGFIERTGDQLQDRLASRALVLDDGTNRLAIVVVDTLMMTRELIDHIKNLARQKTGIPTENILVSATHSHSAPSVMGCLGTPVDEFYLKGFADLVANSVESANQRLQPARIGWAVVNDEEHNHCRRWIFRPDRMQPDPFGQLTVRAHMHPGYESPNHIGPAGPADTSLSLLAVQTPQGKPLAVLANYAFHYFGANPVSSDVCGRFGAVLAPLIQAPLNPTGNSDTPFVGIMSQGTSGDSMWMDYSRPAPSISMAQYVEGLAKSACEAYRNVKFLDWCELIVAQSALTLARRTPDEARLAWAREIVRSMGDRVPRNLQEVYACEQVYLHDRPQVELRLQVIRIGDLGIVAIPCETFGLTGLKLKNRSPLPVTFNIELANGAEGYIPPPEQHALGGYTTWPARTAGLEVQAEPKIVAALLELLERVAPHASPPSSGSLQQTTPYAAAILASKPVAYWRLNDMDGTEAADAAGTHSARLEPGFAFFLPGVDGSGFSRDWRGNRAVHFAGGRLRSSGLEVKDASSVEFWFWNGLPDDARPVTGYLYSRGEEGSVAPKGDQLGIGGSGSAAIKGRLFFSVDGSIEKVCAGNTVLRPRSWYHVVVTREGRQLRVYLNGQATAEIAGELDDVKPASPAQFIFAGRSDGQFSLEGKLDEIAVYDRVLSAGEISSHYAAAGTP